ncbi:LapA family protein [Caldalkalibacillus mannanilyticus]|uniref:LapA family protein n=1 Tax=Caldalkalibacillus mannanilyticus TaxID=1418 RepID=UPI00046AAA09|nr:LapA family protein [Caldalkalibacillus mannanilyticus]
MRVPSAHIFRLLTQIVASFILGMLLGAIIFLFMYGQLMDQSLIDNRKLKSEITELEQELDSIKSKEAEIKNQQKLIVQKINIQIVTSKEKQPNEFIETEITDRMRNDLKFLIGMPLESVADTAETIVHLVNGRKYTIEQQEFSLELDMLVLYTTMTFKVKVKSR